MANMPDAQLRNTAQMRRNKDARTTVPARAQLSMHPQSDATRKHANNMFICMRKRSPDARCLPKTPKTPHAFFNDVRTIPIPRQTRAAVRAQCAQQAFRAGECTRKSVDAKRYWCSKENENACNARATWRVRCSPKRNTCDAVRCHRTQTNSRKTDVHAFWRATTRWKVQRVITRTHRCARKRDKWRRARAAHAPDANTVARDDIYRSWCLSPVLLSTW